MKQKPTIAILLSIISFAYSAVAQTLTLEEATRLMLEFEPELNAVEYDTLSSIEDIKVQRSELLPQVALRGSAGVSNRDRTTDGLIRTGDTLFQRQLGVSLRQLLFDGGVARNNTRASQNAMRAQQYLEKSMIESRAVDLAETYMEILRSQKQISLANNNIANHRRILSLIQKKVANGGHRTELQLTKSRLDRAQNSVAGLQLAYDRSLIRLGRLIGTKVTSLTYPKIPALPHNVNEVSLEDNWEFLAAAEALEEAEHRAKAAKSEHAPRFYLDAGYNMGQDVNGISGQDDEASVLLVGEWNLFNGGRKKSKVRREHFQVGKFEELKRAADLARRNDTDLLWQERQASLRSIGILDSYSKELKGVVGDYEKRFTLGREQLLNILDMQSEHFSVQSDLVDSQFDYDTSTFRVMGKQGKLAEWLLRLEGEGDIANNNWGGKTPVNDPIPVALGLTEELEDTRLPLTQVELMKRVFDDEGPSTDYKTAPMEAYYASETNSRKGIFRRGGLFRNHNKATNTTSFSSEPLHFNDGDVSAPAVSSKPIFGKAKDNDKPKIKGKRSHQRKIAR